VSLFGSGYVPAVRKSPRAKSSGEPDHAVKRCIDLFYDCHVRKWSDPRDVRAWEEDRSSVPKERLVTPRVIGGKHGKKFKEMIAAWSETVVAELVQRFFATTDPKITNTDYSLDAFFGKADYLRLQQVRRRVTDERLLNNLDAAARATGRKV